MMLLLLSNFVFVDHLAADVGHVVVAVLVNHFVTDVVAVDHGVVVYHGVVVVVDHVAAAVVAVAVSFYVMMPEHIKTERFCTHLLDWNASCQCPRVFNYNFLQVD